MKLPRATRSASTNPGAGSSQSEKVRIGMLRRTADEPAAASLEDQIEICRRYAERHGWRTVATYTDAALSGASRFRPGYQQMVADAEAKRFDIIVVEALDRLGRKLADVSRRPARQNPARPARACPPGPNAGRQGLWLRYRRRRRGGRWDAPDQRTRGRDHPARFSPVR
jgi:hypothetical protein